MNIGIYKITSPSNKIYIGQSLNIEKRLKSYQKLKCKGQIKLYNSLLKYGYYNHKVEILEICSVDELNDLEIHYIKLYNSCKEGLNISPGGYLKSKETILKQQNTLKKRYSSGELVSKTKGIPNPKTSILNSKKIGKLNPNSIKCKCTVTGKVYHCLKEAWLELYSNTYKYKTFLQYLRGERKNLTTLIKINEN